MSLAIALKALSARERLSEDAARHATAALLDGGVPELEHGALLALLEPRSDEIAELSGFESALSERCFRLTTSASGVRPVVLSSHAEAPTRRICCRCSRSHCTA
jgi:anthranilate phosphoribosyltransferase